MTDHGGVASKIMVQNTLEKLLMSILDLLQELGKEFVLGGRPLNAPLKPTSADLGRLAHHASGACFE